VNVCSANNEPASDAADFGPHVHEQPGLIAAAVVRELEAGADLTGAVDSDRLVERRERQTREDRDDPGGECAARTLMADEPVAPQATQARWDRERDQPAVLRHVLVAQEARSGRTPLRRKRRHRRGSKHHAEYMADDRSGAPRARLGEDGGI
jgi:hypothetical protein